MSPAMHRSSTMRRGTSEESSGSPARPTRRSSPRRRSPSRRDRSPDRRKTSPRAAAAAPAAAAASPVRIHSSHWNRSPAREKEKLSSRDSRSSPKRGRTSPQASRSRSPSPRTKRLKRAQVEKVSEREHGRSGGDKERYRKRSVDREGSVERSEKRSGRDSRREGGSSSRSRHKRSVSPMERGHGNRHGSRSPARGSRSGGREKVSSPRGDDHGNGNNDSVTRMKAAEAALEANEKQKPSFELSGKLAAETNRVRGVTLLFNEPPDARKPNIRWRLYVFKGGEVLNEPLYIHRQSCYLFGRERRVADIPTDHPSCSKQHAVIQFRQVEIEQPDGMLAKKVRPYLMDLGSTNGTFINDNRIEPQRYYELIEKDTIKFGNSRREEMQFVSDSLSIKKSGVIVSDREYVLLHENSA